MRLLLCSAGVQNPTIRDALTDLLGKPIAESHALCIPTAGYGSTYGPAGPWRFISGRSAARMVDLGWKSVGVLELTALPSVDRQRWVQWVRDADALLVNGGDTVFLAHWMRKSGLADLLPALPEMVYVGSSAGSLALTPGVTQDADDWKSPTGDTRTLGMVDFSIFAHIDNPEFPHQSMAAAERWAAEIPGRAYAIDDDTAIKVADGRVEVVSEGNWKLFTAPSWDVGDLPVLELAAPGPERESGIAAILAGTKTTMTGLPELHERAGEPLPAAGDKLCLVDSDGRPAAVIELTRVDIVPISTVTDDYAHAEGRGYRDATHWRAAHETFFQSDFVAEFLGHTPRFDDDTPVVTQHFRVIGRPPLDNA